MKVENLYSQLLLQQVRQQQIASCNRAFLLVCLAPSIWKEIDPAYNGAGYSRLSAATDWMLGENCFYWASAVNFRIAGTQYAFFFVYFWEETTMLVTLSA